MFLVLQPSHSLSLSNEQIADMHGHARAAFANAVVLCQGRTALETAMHNHADCAGFLEYN